MYPMQKILLTLLLSLGYSGLLQAQNIQALGKNINTKKYTEYAPSLSADGKTLVFQSDRNRYRVWYLYESRLQASGKWSKPRPIDAINNFGQKPSAGNGFQTDFIAAPCLSPDGNTLYFCATFAGGLGKRDLYVAYRQADGQWGRPQNVGAPINSASSEDFPSVSPEGDALYFARPNGKRLQKNTCYDLWVSQKDPQTGNWLKPKKLPKSINTGCEKCPRIQSDGLTLVYSSLGASGKGGFDLRKAVLNVKQDGWEQLGAIDELNGKRFDQFVTVVGSGKGNKAYYNTEGKKTPDIFEVNPLPPSLTLQQVINTTGRVVATADGGQTKYVLEGEVKLELYLLEPNQAPYLLNALKPDAESGGFALALRFGYDYKLVASAEGYEPAEHTLHLKDWTGLNYSIKSPLLLKKIAKSTGALVAENTGKQSGNSHHTNPNPQTLAKAQKALLLNPRTGEVVSSAELSKRLAAKQRSSSGSSLGKTTQPTKLYSEAELRKAFPEFKPYQSERFSANNGNNAQLLAKVKIPHLYFAYKSSQLTPQSEAYLNIAYELMKKQPKLRLRVEAHTDAAGTWSANLGLSEQRAKAVKAYLTHLGIEPHRVIVKGFGEARPLGANPAKNRRAEVYLVASQ